MPPRPKPLILVLSIICVFSLLHLSPAPAQSEAPGSAEYASVVKDPAIRVPFMEKKPSIDGVLKPGEWEDSCAYTGFWQDYGHDMFFFLAIQEKQPTYWMGYDDEFFYVAHRSPIFPEDAWLLAKCKLHDSDTLLPDDHMEFQLVPSDRRKDVMERGWFKWMLNPINTQKDFWFHRQLGLDAEWDSNHVHESQVHEKYWVTEMKIPLETLRAAEYDVRDKDGDPLVQLPLRDGAVWHHWAARAIGGTADWGRLFSAAYDEGWRGNRMKLIFDSAGVAARVRQFGRLMRDDIDLQIDLKNHGQKSQVVKVGFYVENNEELVLAVREKEYVEIQPSEVKSVRIRRKDIGITPQGNAVWVDIRTMGGDLVYRSILIPFHHVLGKEGFKEDFVDGMKYSRPPRRPFDWNFVYYPSVGKVRVSVDTDIYGATQKSKTGRSARATLVTMDGEEIFSVDVPLEKPFAHADAQTFGGMVGEVIADLPASLEDDTEYKMVVLLYDENKRVVADSESPSFLQKNYPWVDNDIGEGDVCWTPFTPIRWNSGERKLETLKHNFTLSQTGLPAQIRIKGDNPWHGNQLRAPVRLEVTRDGERFTYEGSADLELLHDWKSEKALVGSGTAGPVAFRTRVQFECDGFMRAAVWYKTLDDKKVNTIELVMDFDGVMDFMSNLQRGHHFEYSSWRTDVFEKDTKVVWNSLEDTYHLDRMYGNFQPYFLMGNGDRAFMWVCQTDRGMRLTADRPFMQLEQPVKDRYSLRVFLVNEYAEQAAPIQEEQKVEFGLVTLPARPDTPAERRKNSWYFEPLGGTSHIPAEGGVYSIHMSNEEDYAKFHKYTAKERPYTSAGAASWGMPSLKFRTYAGEFQYTMLGAPDPGNVSFLEAAWSKNEVTGRKLDSIFLVSSGGIGWSPSAVDCKVYWRSKQIRLAKTRGFHWDLQISCARDEDPVIGLGYDLPEHKAHNGGRRQPGFHWWAPREMFKRMARVHTTSGVENAHEHYGGADSAFLASFLRDEANWEGAAGYNSGYPHMYTWKMPMMRLSAMTYTNLAGYIFDSRNKRLPGGDPVYDRSTVAHALLHDIAAGKRLGNMYIRNRVLGTLEDFDYFTSKVEYIPYWRSDHLVTYGLARQKEAPEEQPEEQPAEEDEFFAGGEDFFEEGEAPPGDQTGEGEGDGTFQLDEERTREELLSNVYITVYRNNPRKKALIVLANNNPEPVEEPVVITRDLLGRRWRNAKDAEVDQPLEKMPHPSRNGTVRNTLAPIYVAPWGFRLLEVW